MNDRSGKWKPMDTAPKDGTKILVWDYYAKAPTVAAWDSSYWNLVVQGEFAASGEVEPLGWMPLPEGASESP